jgi:hypothetical protein
MTLNFAAFVSVNYFAGSTEEAKMTNPEIYEQAIPDPDAIGFIRPVIDEIADVTWLSEQDTCENYGCILVWLPIQRGEVGQVMHAGESRHYRKPSPKCAELLKDLIRKASQELKPVEWHRTIIEHARNTGIID